MQKFFNINRLIAILFIIIGSAFLQSANSFEPGFIDESLVISPMTYPTWLIYIWLAVSIVYFATAQTTKIISLASSRGPLLRAVLAIGFYFFLFPVLGLPTSTFIFLVAFLLLEGMKKPITIIGISALITFIFWFIFEVLLKISMPRGILDLLG